MKKAIMVLGCHADDVELLAGGTLAKYIQAGYEGYYVQLTRSNSGYNCMNASGACYDDSEMISALRLKEAENAARVFGAKHVFLDFKEHLYTLPDGRLVYADIRDFPELAGKTASGREPVVVACRIQKYVDELTAIVAEAAPEIVIAHGPDTNPDHYAAFLMAYQAAVAASKKVAVGPVYFRLPTYSLGNAFGFEPDWFVDVTGCEETVFAAIRCHVTQTKYMPRENGLIRQWSVLADRVAGAKHVEAFRKIRMA